MSNGYEVVGVDKNPPNLNNSFPETGFFNQHPVSMGSGYTFKYVDVTDYGQVLSTMKGCDAVIQMDGELSHRPEYIPEMLSLLGKYDVVVGSRYIEGGGAADKWGLRRKLLSGVGNFGIKLVSGIQVKDATSGFKAFRISTLRTIRWENILCKGFGFQSEVAFHCQHLKYAVYEMPIVFEERSVGKSKMSIGIVLEAMFRMLFLRLSGHAGVQK